MRSKRRVFFGLAVVIGLFSVLAGGFFRHGLAADLPESFTNSIGMKFVLIPSGAFKMGNANTSGSVPEHEVTVTSPFYMGMFEVTNAEYELYKTGHVRTGSSPDDDTPVNCMKYSEAVGFCQWLTQKEAATTGILYRLPHEIEWEYAAHGGQSWPYPDTDPKNLPGGFTLARALREEANYYGTGGPDRWESVSPVGSLSPNGYGLYDMIGNVKEWCVNKHYDYPAGPVVHDPYHANDGGVSSSHMIRGNSYNTGELEALTVYYRIWYGNNDVSPKTGFRVLALLPAAPPQIPPLKTSLSASPTTISAGGTVQFSGSASGGVPAYVFKWSFGDGANLTGVNPAHQYAAAGTYTAMLTVTDARSQSSSASITITVRPNPPPPVGSSTTVTFTIAAGSDDGQEKPSTGVSLDRSTITVGYGYLNGFRFANVTIPKGAAIVSAKLSTAAEATDRTKALSLTYWGENADNAAPFGTSGSSKLSARVKTSASAAYANVPAWTSANAYHDSADLKAIVQQIVGRPGWKSGNALVILQQGGTASGRVIWAKEGSVKMPPQLTVTYVNP